MHSQFCRRLFAVAIAALAFAASASAQQYGPVVGGQPVYGPFALSVPNTPPIQMSVPVDTTPQPKHTGHLATATRGFVMQSTGSYYCSNCPNAQRCNNGAGSFSADLGFFFGPTKSFFEPCGVRPLPDCSGGLGNGNCSKCRTPILGRGPAAPFPHCTYDIFLNH